MLVFWVDDRCKEEENRTWESLELFPVHLVRNADFNFFEVVENVELGKIEGIITIDQVGVLEYDEV